MISIKCLHLDTASAFSATIYLAYFRYSSKIANQVKFFFLTLLSRALRCRLIVERSRMNLMLLNHAQDAV